jgi:O-antigen/teichoic acid export membrane protein
VDSDPLKEVQKSLSSKIARNSFWYGVEVGGGLLSTLLITVAIARAIGPQRLGYFNYIYWLSNTAGGLGSLGIPAATAKYMAEYLAGGEKGIARAIFFATLRIQTIIASLMMAVGWALVVAKVDLPYRNAGLLLVASILPRMIAFIPSQANASAENVAANTRAALAGSLTYVAAVALSLTLGWDLLGIAAGVFLSACVELGAKLIPVMRWITKLPSGELPAVVKRRMIVFSSQNMVLLVLNMVVWDRSDIVFLRILQSDTRQLAFFSVAFSIIEKLLLIPQSFAGGVGVSQFAEYGRDRQRLLRMTATAAKYVFLCGLPLLVGVAAISKPLIGAVYGSQYLPMIRVFQLMALFAIPRTILFPAYNLLLATENQKVLVIWNCVCGVVNVVLDLVLIPLTGAVGAAAANGIAQALASIGVWVFVCRHFSLELDLAFFWRLSVVGLFMAMAELFIVWFFPGWRAIPIGTGIGLVVLVLGLRFVSILTLEDRQRLLRLAHLVPGRARGWASWLIAFLIPISPEPAV